MLGLAVNRGVNFVRIYSASSSQVIFEQFLRKQFFEFIGHCGLIEPVLHGQISGKLLFFMKSVLMVKPVFSYNYLFHGYLPEYCCRDGFYLLPRFISAGYLIPVAVRLPL